MVSGEGSTEVFMGFLDYHVRDYHENTNVMQAAGLITSVKTIGERIRWARDQRALTQAALAKKAGVAQGTIGNAEAGTRGKPRELLKIARALMASPDWLESGKGKWDDVQQDERSTEFLPGFEQLSIPLLANSGAMGDGSDQLHDDVVVGRITVSPEWALRTLKPTALEALRFIHGYGDSMSPTFLDGDVLLVDVGVKECKVDGVYVLEANERIYIKRVRQRMNGDFEISSDNPTVKTVDVLDGSHTVGIRGRVLWAWNGRKL